MASSVKALPLRFLLTVSITLSAGAILSQDVLSRHKHALLFRIQEQSAKAIILFADRYEIIDLRTGLSKSYASPGIGKRATRNRLHLLGEELVVTNDTGREIETARTEGLPLLRSGQKTKSEINHREFIHGDTLFRHGGYGYWSANGELTFLDSATKEWELVRTSDGLGSVGMFNHFILTQTDQWYFIGGKTVSRQDPLQLNHNDELWIFVPGKRKWLTPGHLNTAFLPVDTETTIALQDQNRLIFFPVNGMMLVADMKKETVRLHRMSLLAESAARTHYLYHEPGVFNGKVHFLLSTGQKKETKAEEAEYDLIRIPVDRFIGDFIREEPLFREGMSNSWTWLLIPIAGSLLVIPYVLSKKSRRKITIAGDRLVCLSVSHSIEPVAFSVLKVLIENPGGVTSSRIMELVENPSLDFSQNTRNKIRILDNLNAQLKTLLEIRRDAIIIKKDPTDRRIKIYRLDRTFFE